MELETIGAVDFGQSLRGFGVNLLVRDVSSTAQFLVDVFAMKRPRVSEDFAILEYHGQLLQLHGDHTYHGHPLPSLLPEAGARGAGIELRLYETDPDHAAEAAKLHQHESTLLQAPMNKPHGLREAVILCENGYAWLPSRALKNNEVIDPQFS